MTLNANLYLLLCRENVQTFTCKIAIINDFDSGFGYRNLHIHRPAICEPLQGENAWSHAGKLKLTISSIRDHIFSEFIFCSNARLNEIEEDIWTACDIRHIMEIGKLFLVYQPIVGVNTRTILGARVLCRWVSAEWRTASPLKFITIAENIRFINELGYQVIKTAVGEFRHFSQHMSLKDDLLLHINASPWQLSEPHSHERFTTTMKKNGLKANSLCVEIAETVIERINEYSYLNVEQLCKQGVRISIDDLGAGLLNLKRFYEVNPDSTKVDSQFIGGIFGTTGKIVRTIFDLACYNRILTITESTESEDVTRGLTKLGCAQA